MTPISLGWSATEDDHLHLMRRLLWRALLVRGALTLVVVWGVAACFASFDTPFGDAVALVGGLVWPLLVVWSLWRFPGRRVAGMRAAGVLPLGPMSVRLGPDGVRFEQEGWTNHYGWGSFTTVAQDRRGLWLWMSSVQVLFVPARAGHPDLAAIAAMRADSVLPPDLPPGAGPWTAEGELEIEDWVTAVRLASAGATHRLARTLLYGVLFLVLGACFKLLGVSPTPAWGGFATLVLVWSASWGRLAPYYAAWSLRRALRREPTRAILGPFALRAGDDGLWIRSTRGSMRCSWSWVTHVAHDDRVIALTLGQGSVAAIPVRALPDPAGFVAACRTLSASAPRLRGGAPPPGRGAAQVGDPFAAPEG